MSSRHSLFRSLFLFGALGLSAARQASAQSATRPLTEQGAVERAIAHNPSLHVALLRATQAEYDVRAEEGLYSTVGSASAGYTRSRTPSVSDDGVQVSTGTSIDVAAGLRKPFPFGTVVDLSVSGQRLVRETPAFAGSPGLQLGPTYALGGQLALLQPLLRGFGTEIGRASLRQSRLRRTAATLAADATASALLNDVLRAYWELWYSDRVIAINEASRELAREQARQAELRAQSGDIAEIDVLVYQTRRAELDEAVVIATTDRSQRSLSLGLLMAGPSHGASNLAIAEVAPEPAAAAADTAVTLAEAERSSPELAELQAQIELAAEQERIAGDPLRPRLDLDAYVQVQGLGDREVPPAFEQVGRMQAVSAHVGLTFEAPIDGTRRRSQVASARLTQHIAQKQLGAARERLRTEVLSALAARAAAESRVQVATETIRVASAQAEAERRRFAAGISIALQVQEAENSLRQAQLRLERARVDWMLSEISLAYLRGRLLERYRGAVKKLSPPPPNVAALPVSRF